MKFTVAWANVISQNITLRIVVGVLTLCSLFFSIALARLAIREPLIIERECFSRTLNSSNGKHNDKEIENFIRVAIPLRFDSKTSDYRSYLSDDEISFRMKEQDDMIKKGMIQRVLVTNIKIEKDLFTVDTDRIFSLGKVRSALSFPLTVELLSVTRTASNPYGLILKRVKQVVEKENSK